MSLDKTLQKATKDVFGATKGILTQVTYRSINGVVYSPAVGVVVNLYTDYQLRVAFSSFTQQELYTGLLGGRQLPQLVQPQDRKCVFPVKKLPVEPKLSDVIIENSSPGRVWDVIYLLRTPGQAVYVLQVRQL